MKLLFLYFIMSGLSCLAEGSWSNAGMSGVLRQHTSQKNQAPAGKGRVGEVLTPLTDEERALDLRALIANQPDFAADLKFFVAEHKIGGAYGGTHRIVRKGNRYRLESQFWIFVGEAGKQTARLFSGDKTFDDMEPPRLDSMEEGGLLENPRILLSDQATRFAVLGSRVIEGHKCIKIEVVRKDQPEKIYLYAARNLKNLIIVSQTLGPEKNTGAGLSNITLDVSNDLVEIPAGYKSIEHDRWVKVETAQVTYKGRPSKDFGVFRAPGGELFIWVNDARYPWHYLVRPKLKTVETAFQGLLVTRSGRYIWETKDTEAFSQTDYRSPTPPGPYGKSEEESRVVVTSNSVKFRSNNYDQDQSMIEVRW